MRKSLIAAAAALGLFVGVAFTARAETKEYKGVLIDQKCGSGKDEAGAAKHTKACTLKCCDKAGLALISGSTEYKLDDASATKAKEYLEKNDSTKVVIKGEEKDGKLSVSSIDAQK
jgi:hypothetical protein